MGISEKHLAKIAFEHRAPTGRIFRLRRPSLAVLCRALGGVPSFAEQAENGNGTATVKLEELQLLASYQDVMVSACVLGVRLPDEIEWSPAGIDDIDPEEIVSIIAVFNDVTGMSGEGADEARRFPDGPAGGDVSGRVGAAVSQDSA